MNLAVESRRRLNNFPALTDAARSWKITAVIVLDDFEKPVIGPALANVFANAAPPQKVVLIVLAAATPVALIAGALALMDDARRGVWSRTIACLGMAGPALGLLVGGLNSFHMGQTIRRLPFDPTLKQLAPGILEVSALVSLGALAGLAATLTAAAVSAISSGRRAT